MKTNQEISFFMNIGGQIKQDIADSLSIKECGVGMWLVTCKYTLRKWSKVFKRWDFGQFDINFPTSNELYRHNVTNDQPVEDVERIALMIFKRHASYITSTTAEFFDVPRDYVNKEFLKIL